MAFIVLKNNHGKSVTATAAVALWRVMNGEIEGTPAQLKFIQTVKKIYLNKESAPKSYLEVQREQNREVIQYALPYKD